MKKGKKNGSRFKKRSRSLEAWERDRDVGGGGKAQFQVYALLEMGESRTKLGEVAEEFDGLSILVQSRKMEQLFSVNH